MQNMEGMYTHVLVGTNEGGQESALKLFSSFLGLGIYDLFGVMLSFFCVRMMKMMRCFFTTVVVRSLANPFHESFIFACLVARKVTCCDCVVRNIEILEDKRIKIPLQA